MHSGPIIADALSSFFPEQQLYNKKIKQVNNKNETVMLTFENNLSAEYDYLVISDGVFSPTKSLVANKQIEPKYFTSIFPNPKQTS